MPKVNLGSFTRSGNLILVGFLLFLMLMPALIIFTSQPVRAAAGINEKINFQGKLVNPNGTNVSNGNYSIVFTLYDASSGGTNLWDETQTVAVNDGIFQVALGSVDTTLGLVDFNSDQLFLGIKVGADAEMTPRIQFTAVPYAFNAKKLSGLTSSQFVQLAQGVQVDSSTASSIFLNKTGATGNIVQLQDAGSDVFVIGNDGNTSINTNSATALTVQNGSNNAFVVDTTNIKVGIGITPASAASRLSVAGQGLANGITLGDGAVGSANLYVSANDTLKTDDSLIVGTIGTGGTNLLCYDGSNKLAACSAAPGSGNYIYNGTGLQANANFNIQSVAAQSGTGTISSSTTTVTGVGTSFTTQLSIGDFIIASGQSRRITAIASNTSLTTVSAFSPAISAGTSFTHEHPAGRFVAASSQVADVLQVQTSAGGSLVRVDSAGRIFSAAEIEAFDGTAILGNNKLQLNAGSFELKGGGTAGQGIVQAQGNVATTLILRGGAGGFQSTTDLMQLQNDTGTVILSQFTSTGALQGGSVTGSNVAGTSLVLNGGQGTGSAVGGNILLQYAPAGGSGSSANALQTACLISGTNGSLSCPGAGATSERFGAGSTASGANGVSLGNGASAAGSGTIAIGKDASAGSGGTNSIAIGNGATADNNSVVIGPIVSSGAQNNVIIGINGATNGANNTAIGSGAVGGIDSNVAIGTNATTASSTGSIAIGVGATTGGNNRLVIGSGSSNASIQNAYIGNGVTNGSPLGFTLQGTGSSTAGTAGASVTLTAGAGASTTTGSSGGTLNLQGGASGGSGNNQGGSVAIIGGVSTGTSTGSSVTITGGTAIGTNQIGGTVTIQGGAPTGTGASGSVIIKSNINNSTTAFQVQNAASASLLNIDSTTGNLTVDTTTLFVDAAANRVGIGTVSPGATLEVVGTATLSGGAINLNNNSNFATNINTGSSTGTVTIGNASNSANTVSIEGGSTATAIQIGNGGTAHGVQIATGAAVQTVVIGSTNTTSSTTLQAGSGNINLNASQAQFSEVAGTRVLTVQTRSTNDAGSNLTIAAGSAGSGASAFAGGVLTLQGGAAAGTGNATGGDVVVQGGSGMGTSVQGLVKIASASFTASPDQVFTNVGGTIDQSAVDNYSVIPVTVATGGGGATVVLNAPSASQQVKGRLLYVAALNGSKTFTIAPSGGVNFLLNANASATFVWNGNGWSNAGVDAGSASFILNQSTSSQTTANFWISGTGKVDTAFISPLFRGEDVTSGSQSSANIVLRSGDISSGSGNTTGNVTIKSGDSTNSNNSTGNVVIDSGAKSGSGTAGTISIGTTNATGITIGSSVAATTNINSPTIATTATTLSLFNTNAATVTALQAATSISIGATTGTLTVRNANQTFGNAAGSGVFTNNGATLNSTLAVLNDSDGGSLGGTPGTPLTAAQSVDVYTSISVFQTTAGQTITLPAPTANTTYGRVVYLSNIGSASFTFGSTTVNPGTTATLIWSNTNGGASWQFAGADGNGILNQNSADQTANFRISGTGRANTSFISPLVDGISVALGGAASLGVGTSSIGTTALTVGNTSASFALESSATANLFTGATAHTIAIGTNASGDNDVSVGSTNAGSTLTLEAGTGTNAIQIGNGSTNHEIRIGSNASGVQTVGLGSTGSTSSTTISGGTGTATGDVVLQTAASGIINIGTNNVATKVINIGSVAAVAQNTTVQIASSSAGVQAVTVGSLSSTSTLNLQGGTGTAAGDINIGDSTLAAKIIDIGSVTNAGTSTIRIATAAAAQTVTVGSADTTSTTTIQAGSGSINLIGSGGSNTGIKVTTSANSTAAFQIQSASAADTLLRADTSGNVIKIGNDTGTTTATTQFVLDNATTAPTADGAGVNGAMYYDSTLGRIQCYESGVWGRCSALNQNVTLVPEYQGAVLTGDGGSNVGTMTSDFCSDFQNIADGGGAAACDTGQEHNYYSWTTTQGSTQDYDIFVRYQLPSDFGGFVSSSSIQMYGWRTDNGAGNLIDVSMFEGSTQCGTTTNVATAAATDWSLVALSGDETGCSGLAAGDTVLFRIHVSAENTEFVRAGEIVFDYKSK